jgi:hypothetical protein
MAKAKKEKEINSVSSIETFATNPVSPIETEAQKFPVREVAEQYMKGFKPQWLPGIEAFVKSRGYPEIATLDECKVILQQWGGGAISFK